MERSGRILGPLLCTLAMVSVQADVVTDEPAVTPYRPSAATPAALSAPGWLELEGGGFKLAQHDHSSQVTIPYAVKLAFSEDWGVRLAGNSWVENKDESGNVVTGQGDTGIIVKRRFALDDKSAFGLEAGIVFPTSKAGLGLSKRAWVITGIYSAEYGAFHSDANLYLMHTALEDAPEGAGRMTTGWAWALSRQLSENWSVTGEFSGTRQTGAPSTSQFLMAGAYTPVRSFSLDFGAAFGLNNQSPKWSIFGGVTMLGMKLF
ncbi:transporter [Burkholderiaceae bacterium DAT-1]|nr:transporter [Burkholderiaceae bacterium DAT-1]